MAMSLSQLAPYWMAAMLLYVAGGAGAGVGAAARTAGPRTAAGRTGVGRTGSRREVRVRRTGSGREVRVGRTGPGRGPAAGPVRGSRSRVAGPAEAGAGAAATWQGPLRTSCRRGRVSGALSTTRLRGRCAPLRYRYRPATRSPRTPAVRTAVRLAVRTGAQ